APASGEGQRAAGRDYIQGKGQWRSLDRAVEQQGQTMDFLRTEPRDPEAALRFLKKAIRCNELPAMIPMDGSDAKKAAIKSMNEELVTTIATRPVNSWNYAQHRDGWTRPHVRVS